MLSLRRQRTWWVLRMGDATMERLRADRRQAPERSTSRGRDWPRCRCAAGACPWLAQAAQGWQGPGIRQLRAVTADASYQRLGHR